MNNLVRQKKDVGKIAILWPMIDFLTLTSFEPLSYESWSMRMEKESKDASFMQYSGKMDSQGCFVGTAEQGGRQHNMLRFPGCGADETFPLLAQGIREHWARATRVDLQVTNVSDMDMWRLFNRLKKSGKNVSYISSGTGSRELATVYIGSRKSNRYVRIYQKLLPESKKAVRFEVEYKSIMSQSVTMKLAKESGEDARRELIGSYIRGEIQRVGDAVLSKVFESLDYRPVTARPIKIEPGESNTERWLVEVVLPSLERFISSHGGASQRVRDAFLHVLLD